MYQILLPGTIVQSNCSFTSKFAFDRTLCVMIPSLANSNTQSQLFSLLHPQRDIATATRSYLVIAILSMASSMAPSVSTLLALLKKKGFDPDEVNKACRVPCCGSLWLTPLCHFSAKGNIIMCRYLLSRGADCSKTDRMGRSPMHWAALYSHFEIVQLLYHDAGAHEDIRRLDMFGCSTLFLALHKVDFEIVYWLIRKQALSTHDDGNGGGIDDAIMRRDLRQSRIWEDDQRLTVLSWARDVITTHDTVKVLLITGTIVPTSLFRRHPNNPYATRSNKRRKTSSSPLVMLKGKAGILELIAHYVAGTPQELRPLRQLLTQLPAFIADVPFVVEDEHGGE